MAENPGVLVRETGMGGLAQEIRTGRHMLVADEPVALGGSGSGPTPYEFLLAALGSCTSMTVRMYAQRKRWPLKRVTVLLRHSRVHAQDCTDCETKAGMIDRIERDITLEGELTPEQRTRLMEIADKCPVHRTLTSEIGIKTRQIEVA